ncbi:MAG TPA: hypothetical protein VKG45_09240 [Actinomycetes bacterium]|nr:hypothetical protein [Actinomycetes bacterium]
MPSRSVRRRAVPRIALLAALLLLVAGCGGSGSGGGDGGDGQQVAEGFSVFVASFDLAAGTQRRFMAGLQLLDNRLVADGTVTMRFAWLGDQQRQDASAAPTITVTGRYLPVPGSPPPSDQARPRPVQPTQSRGVYEAPVTFDRPGFWGVEVRADLDGVGLRRGTSQFQVHPDSLVVDVGDKAPASRNLTLADKGVPKTALDSRAQGGRPVPNPQLHRTTIAAAIAAHRPAVVVFATPVYCTSQFCGPVTDMVADLAKRYSDRADFIHVEIWRDFDKKEIARAARQWLLREGNLNEPWVFLIGADGRVAARFDNVCTRGELEPLLQRLPERT